MPPLHNQTHKDEKMSPSETAPESSKMKNKKFSNGIDDECSGKSIYCDPIISSYGDSIGLALDAIVVEPCRQSSLSSSPSTQTQKPVDTTDREKTNAGIVASSDFSVQFPVQPLLPDNEYRVKIQINGNNLKESFLCMTLPNGAKRNVSGAGMCNFQQGQSTKPSTEILNKLVDQQVLIPGRNLVRYILVRKSKKNSSESDNNENVIPIGTAEAFCFLWSVHDKVIISDIDGTVTKSNLRGFVSTIVTEKYGHVHDGICSLFSELVKYDGQNKNDDPIGETTSIASDSSPGMEEKKDQCDHPTPIRKRGQVRFLYLSARPLKFINTTRKFIAMLSQTQAPHADGSSLKRPFTSCLDPSESTVEDGGALQLSKEEYKLPPGPVITHTGTASNVINMELKKKTHEFKADTLTRQIVLPFVAAGKKSSGSRLFIAGFGNQRTDYLGYEMAGMNSHDIYIIDKSSQLVSTNAKELELETVYNLDAVGVDSLGIACCAWEPFSDLGAKDATSSVSGSATNSKRLFQGYADPKLKLELLNRLH